MGEIQHNMIFKLVKEERTITNIRSNEDRVLCNMTPLQRLYSIDEDTYEELVCVWAYSCLGNKGYTEVYRVGQAGDKGRDVLAYYDRVKGAFDLY